MKGKEIDEHREDSGESGDGHALPAVALPVLIHDRLRCAPIDSRQYIETHLSERIDSAYQILIPCACSYFVNQAS